MLPVPPAAVPDDVPIKMQLVRSAGQPQPGAGRHGKPHVTP